MVVSAVFVVALAAAGQKQLNDGPACGCHMYCGCLYILWVSVITDASWMCIFVVCLFAF